MKLVLDLFFPRRCAVCGTILGAKEEYLCLGCEAELPRTLLASRRHNPMADQFNSRFEQGPYGYAAALFNYEGPYRSLTKALKYNGNIPLGRHLARMLVSEMICAEHWKDVDTVVPVPLHWTRRISRGYNQAEVIAREIAAVLGARLETGLLVRCRHTRSQARLSIENKAANVSGAFRINTRALHYGSTGNHILLVDDVFTTGATLAECEKALRKAVGTAVRISVATLAVVPDWR